MFGGGKGMGGGGGSMLKVVGRAVTRAGVTTVQETLSSSSTNTTTTTNNPISPTPVSRSNNKFCSNNNNILSLSSASGFPCNTLVSANTSNSLPSLTPPCCDDYEWVSLDGSEEDGIGVGNDFFLGPVPSVDEVHSAVSALTQVFDAPSCSQFITDKFSYNADKDVSEQISSPTGILRHVSPVGSDSDLMEPSSYLCNSRMLNCNGHDRVYDALHLLQNEPSIQRMVISLSSDKAVWNAVLNNEVVRELRETYNAEESVTSPTSENSDEAKHDSNPAMNVVRRIFENTKGKFMEAIEIITELMHELFKTHDDEKKTTSGATDPFEVKLRTSFLLSVVVLLVVVVTRAYRA